MLSAIKKHVGDFAAIMAVFALAVGVAGYILVNQDARPTFPLIEPSPITIEAEFSDARAVVPGQGQSVRVAGVQVGKIGSVELEDGLAVVGMNIEAEYAGLVREDASALLRPRTGLKDMFVELDPGTEAQPAMEEGDRISVENTAPDIDPDEILSALDTDTRAYLKLLVTGLGKGLDNNGDELREVFQRLEPLHRDLAKVQGAFADRREELAQLVHNYGILTEELGRQDEDLVRLVTASNDVFESLASVDAQISQSVAQLPGTLRTTENTLRKVNDLGAVLGPTLDDLRPAFRQLDVANREIRPLLAEAPPILRDEIRPFVRRARPYVANSLKPAARNLAQALPDLTTAFGELNRFFNMLAFNPAGAGEANQGNPITGNTGVGDNDDGQPHRGGETVDSDSKDEGYLYWLAHVVNNGVSLHSTSDAEGPVRRGSFSINCTTAVVLLEALFIGSAGPAGEELLNTLLEAGDGGALIDTIVGASPALGGTIAPVLSAAFEACPQIFDTGGGGGGGGGGGLPGIPGAGAEGARQGQGQDQGTGDEQGLGAESAPEGEAAPEDQPLDTDEGDQEGSG